MHRHERAFSRSRRGPILEKLQAYLQEQRVAALPKSPLGAAIGYALRNWVALTRYAEDGRLKIDNNGAEQALRTIVLGRKNWLFAGERSGGAPPQSHPNPRLSGLSSHFIKLVVR
jgi:transposase